MKGLGKGLGSGWAALALPPGMRPKLGRENEAQKEEEKRGKKKAMYSLDKQEKDPLKERKEYLKKLRLERATPYNEIDPRMANIQLAVAPDVWNVPIIADAQKKLPNPDAVITILSASGSETREQVDLDARWDETEMKIEELNKQPTVSGESAARRSSLIKQLEQLRDKLYIDWEKFWSKRWATPYADCNIYAAQVAMTLTSPDRDHLQVSHTVSEPGNKPLWNQGKELNPGQMKDWMITKGPEYGWKDVTSLSKEERLKLLSQGNVIYGAREDGYHNWLIVGIPDAQGNTIACLSQSSFPRWLDGVETIPNGRYYDYKWDRPTNPANKKHKSRLFAHKMLGAR